MRTNGSTPDARPQYRAIDPDQARTLLEDPERPRNRPISATRVAALAADIREGRWADLSDPIRVDEHGHLLDGQHRLAAIVQAGATLRLPVMSLSRDLLRVIDTGVSRSARDILKIARAAKNYSVVAGALKYYRALTEGGEIDRGGLLSCTRIVEIYDTVEERQAGFLTEISDRFARGWAHARWLLQSGSAALSWYLWSALDRGCDRGRCDALLESLQEGGGRGAAKAVRRWLEGSRRVGRRILPSQTIYCLERAFRAEPTTTFKLCAPAAILAYLYNRGIAP